jgi:hypothetical protein
VKFLRFERTCDPVDKVKNVDVVEGLSLLLVVACPKVNEVEMLK